MMTDAAHGVIENAKNIAEARDTKAILNDYYSARSIDKVVEKWGFASRNALYTYVCTHRKARQLKRWRCPPVTEHEVDIMMSLHRDNKPPVLIADMLGRSTSTVTFNLLKRGVSPWDLNMRRWPVEEDV